MTNTCFQPSSHLLSVEQALTEILSAISPLDSSETIPVDAGLGRVLAASISSQIDVPPQRIAAMDGYGFDSLHLPTAQPARLRIVGTSWAGQPFRGHLAAGECVRIFTGAVVPDAVDSVLPQEMVSADGVWATLPDNPATHGNIRPAGSDFQNGEELIAAPKLLEPADLGLLAAAGISELTVRRQLRIGFFSTGDELTPVGQTLTYGQIYDSNRHLLAGLLRHENHCVENLGIVADDRQRLEKLLIDAAERCDVIISTGGASVGDADFVKQTLEKCGQINFWKLAIKPGKPLAFGRIKHCWFFGLPGNPVAVLVTYKKFVQPAMTRLLGLPAATALQLLARCDSKLKKSPGRQEYQRGVLRQTAPGQFAVTLAGGQDSHQQKVTSQANCFIVLDDECAGVAAGESVVVEPFHSWL